MSVYAEPNYMKWASRMNTRTQNAYIKSWLPSTKAWFDFEFIPAGTHSWISFATLSILFCSTMFLTGCLESGGGVSGGGSGGTPGGGLPPAILTFQGDTSATWKTSVSGQLLTTNKTLTVTGTCSRGIDHVVVNINGVDSGTPGPCVAQVYTWVYTVPGDGTYPISVAPVTGAGTILGSAAFIKELLVKVTPPSNPVITTNGGANFTTTQNTFTLNGTVSSDTQTMSTNDNGTLTLVPGTSFSYAGTISDGQTKTITFNAYDLLLNKSGGTSIKISYIANLGIQYSNISGAGIIAPKVGTVSNLVSVSSDGITSANTMTSPGTGLKLMTGVTNVGVRGH